MFLAKRFAIWTAALTAIFTLSTKARAADTLLFDFGADATPTTGGVAPEPIYWNNLTTGVGGNDFGILPDLVTTNNTVTPIAIQMVARFNGANENGTQTGNTQYPISATRDSLYGNTELFGPLENIFPVFKLTGLDPAATYTLTFYASRTGVGDNRETRYTVTGATETTRDFNAANNITNTVSVAAMGPDANGEITIALTPGPNNNNANHFTYLGVLQIDPSTGSRLLVDFGSDPNATIAGTEPPSPFWNNVTATAGTNPEGTVTDIVTTNGTVTPVGLKIVSRFNASNSNGATTSTNYPTTATQDSLFGNTEAFNGISNVKPVFKLTGLDPAYVYTFNFYGSRNGVSDNRETRYTVTGTNTAFGDLNTANNTNNTVTVSGIRPTEAGEIQVELTPGPGNNNANHFTYLGVMRVDYEIYLDPQILIDFGAAGRPTTPAVDPTGAVWNNISNEALSDTGRVTNLRMTGGSPSPINFVMVSRFNGINESGTEFSAIYPLDATRDSVFGNTEGFSGLTNITPIFKLTGLVPNRAYKITFYASRGGVGDNRETRYTVTGESTRFVDLDAANNLDNVALLENVFADASGEARIALTPGPNNNNSNHFTYLGVLQMDWLNTTIVKPTLSQPSYANGSFQMLITGVAGKTYKVERTFDFTGWSDTGVTLTLTGASGTVTVPQAESMAFYRIVEQ